MAFSRTRRRLARLLVVILLAAGLPALAPSLPASAALTLPSGFSLLTEETGQAAYDLTDFAVLPDGSKYTIGKRGTVAWVSADRTVVRKVAQIPVHGYYDVGLVGIWPAPNYDETGHLYLVYPKPGVDVNTPGANEVARFTANNPANPTSLGNKLVILGGISQDLNYHGAGTVLAAPDGSIYAGFGDAAHFIGVQVAALRALSLDDPHGKILRVDVQGRGWPTNPYYNPASPSSWRSRVFALGLRNPTRFTLDPRTGRVYIGDVGHTGWEEVNVARGGENFGWPCYEGSQRAPGYQDLTQCKTHYANNVRHDLALYAYPHAGAQAAVIGGPFYTGTSYPTAYRGRLFFADYAQQVMRTIGTDINDQVTSPAAVLGTGLGAPVAVHPEINGDITYADIISGKIKRLKYSAGNRAPTAAASATNDPATLKVIVDASASSDLDGDALTYSTNFGDGSPPVSGVTASHTYTDGTKTYDVLVEVKDPLGAKGTVTLKVKPSNHTPQLQLTTPPAGHKFAVGEPVTIGATATDQENGPLTPHYQVVLYHCPFGAGCHAHPNDVADGPSLTRPFPDHGDDTKMVITVSVTDLDGATVSEVYEALPDVRQLSVVSPVPVRVNGLTVTSLPLVAGAMVTVEAPTLAAGRQFTSWSDGGAATHSFAMPAADLKLTANYLTEIATKYAEPGVAAALGTPTGTENTWTTGSLLGGKGRLYQNGVIMWSQNTGAHYVKGALFQRYWPGTTPYLYGFPIADEVAVPGGYASYFQRGREYWSLASGAHFVKGAILTKYLAFGGPVYGFPTIDEAKALDGRGYYSHFTNGKSIFWHPSTGAHGVQGAIRNRWASLGWERSCLGYPTSDEYRVAVGYQSKFQHGYITWNATTRVTSYRCT